MCNQQLSYRWLLFAVFLIVGIFFQATLCLGRWLGETPTSDVPDGGYPDGSQCVAADVNANLHAVWGSNAGLKYREYLRGGGWASEAERVDDGSDIGGTPCMAVDGAGNVHVVWWTYHGGSGEIYYRERHVLTGWDAAPTLLGNSSVDELSPSIAVDGQGVVHVVWRKNTPSGPKIRYVLKDPGTGWGDGYIISQAEGGINPCICVDGQDNLHVTWIGGNYDVYYRKYTHGIGWDASPTKLTSEPYYKDRTCIAADGLGCVHVVWERGTFEIKYKRFVPGVGWDAAVMDMSPVDSLYSRNPSITADDAGTVHVVWGDDDYRTDWGDIFCRHFSPGTGWSEPEQVTVTTSWYTFMPSISVNSCGDGGILYVRHAESTAYLKPWVNDAAAGSGRTGSEERFVYRAYPNPFWGSIQVSYELAGNPSGEEAVRLEVLDVRGRLVRTLTEGQYATGERNTMWNGLGNDGHPVAPGIYYVRLTAGQSRRTVPIVLVR